MIRTQIYLTEPIHEAIKARAKSSGRKQSELIREALEQHFQRDTKKDEASWKEGISKAFGMWEDHDTIDDIIKESRRLSAERLNRYE